MKIRNGFVSNSSSSSFIITNLTNNYKKLVDFAKETAYLVELYNDEYGNKVKVDEFMLGCANRQIKWNPKEKKEVIFGDEDGDYMGLVYDYMLRDADSTESFSWYFNESLR